MERIKPSEIPDRITIRLDQDQKHTISNLSLWINEEDLSKIVKFSLEAAEHNIKKVTDLLINDNWEVLFMRKRKTNIHQRKLY